MKNQVESAENSFDDSGSPYGKLLSARRRASRLGPSEIREVEGDDQYSGVHDGGHMGGGPGAASFGPGSRRASAAETALKAQ